MDRRFKTSSGRFDLQAVAVQSGRDLTVVVSGGAAHLGAVVAAMPRPSLDDPSRTSADLMSLSFPGHKEDELARAMARHLAAALNSRVVVAAGAHWDDLTPEGIKQVLTNAEELTRQLVDHYRPLKPAS